MVRPRPAAGHRPRLPDPGRGADARAGGSRHPEFFRRKPEVADPAVPRRPGGDADGAPIVVGYDGSEGAQRRARRGARARRRARRRVVLVFSYEITGSAARSPTTPTRCASTGARSSRGRSSGVLGRPRRRGARGRQQAPAHGLLAIADEADAQMIVIGSYGERPLEGAVWLDAVPAHAPQRAAGPGRAHRRSGRVVERVDAVAEALGDDGALDLLRRVSSSSAWLRSCSSTAKRLTCSMRAKRALASSTSAAGPRARARRRHRGEVERDPSSSASAGASSGSSVSSATR